MARERTQEEIRAIYDGYMRHLFHSDPAAQASAAGYLATLHELGYELSDFDTGQAWQDITLERGIARGAVPAEVAEAYERTGSIEQRAHSAVTAITLAAVLL